jgi:hypothetical protein
MKIKFMSCAEVLKALKSSKPKGISRFDYSIILNFSLPFTARKNYVDGLMSRRGFTYLGKGRHRMTYLSPNRRFVLKFPHNEEGLAANRDEASVYKEALLSKEKDYPYAPCRLVHNAINLMVAVTEVYGGTEADDRVRDNGILDGKDFAGDDDMDMLPSWAHDIDALQVGKLPNGRLVAYDYGL